MLDAHVQLLRAIGARRRNHDGVIRERAKLAAVPRAERQHAHALRARRLGRAQHVGRIAARRVNDEQIARPRQRLDSAARTCARTRSRCRPR